MDGYFAHGAIEMERGSHACIDGGVGMLVEVLDGELWITQERDKRDYFVAAGASLLLAREGRVVLSAHRRSRITLTPTDVKRRSIYEALVHRLMRLWTNPATAAL